MWKNIVFVLKKQTVNFAPKIENEERDSSVTRCLSITSIRLIKALTIRKAEQLTRN